VHLLVKGILMLSKCTVKQLKKSILFLFQFKCFVLRRQIMSMPYKFKLLLCKREKLCQICLILNCCYVKEKTVLHLLKFTGVLIST